jgi:Holliday junction resolvase RusA-like endonuclease
MQGMTDAHLVTIEVTERPATFATASEKLWKYAVRAAVAASGVQPRDARFAVRIDFWLGVPHNASEVWDLDNLIKPTLDAMEGVFGTRAWNGHVQAADDRVDRLEAVKRQPCTGEEPGATIDVWIISADQAGEPLGDAV